MSNAVVTISNFRFQSSCICLQIHNGCVYLCTYKIINITYRKTLLPESLYISNKFQQLYDIVRIRAPDTVIIWSETKTSLLVLLALLLLYVVSLLALNFLIFSNEQLLVCDASQSHQLELDGITIQCSRRRHNEILQVNLVHQMWNITFTILYLIYFDTWRNLPVLFELCLEVNSLPLFPRVLFVNSIWQPRFVFVFCI